MINYKVYLRKNPADPTAAGKYHGISTSKGVVTERDISTRIARESTVSIIDVRAVIEAFLQVIPDVLSNGNIVKLDEFGSFRTTLKCEGAVSSMDFTNANIKKVNVRFAPAKEFKKVIAVTEFKKIG